MLMSLQAGSIHGTGVELAVPGDPQCIRCTDEGGNVFVPFVCNLGQRIHVERAVDDAPCVTRVCRRTELVFCEESLGLASHFGSQPPGSVSSVLRSILPRVCGECVPVLRRLEPKLVRKAR